MKQHCKANQSSRGFSLIETMVVAAIILIILAASIPQILLTMKEANTRTAYEDVLSAMRRAHEVAIDRQRVVKLTFTPGVGTTAATIQVLEEVKGVGPGGGTIYSPAPAASTPNPETTTLPHDMNFVLPSTLPGKNPDGLPATGTPAAATDYGYNSTSAGGLAIMYFQANGQVLENNENGPVADGVIYVGRATKDAISSRAVSILGQTGRVKGWRIDTTTGNWKEN